MCPVLRSLDTTIDSEHGSGSAVLAEHIDTVQISALEQRHGGTTVHQLALQRRVVYCTVLYVLCINHPGTPVNECSL